MENTKEEESSEPDEQEIGIEKDKYKEREEVKSEEIGERGGTFEDYKNNFCSDIQ